MSSQGNEDAILESILAPRGRLLDIGAFNPEVYSNSRALIERGWEAVLIEPSPVPLREVVLAYCDNRKVQVVCAAVATERTWLTLELSDDGLSTSEPANVAKWSKEAGFYGRSSYMAITPEDISLRFGQFDFVSIDTEGTSVDIALEVLRYGMRPVAMCVEHDNRLVELAAAYHPLNYTQRYLSNENVIFAR